MKKEPLKNKGTKAIKFVDFIIDLFKQQAKILSKQEGVEASLNEEGVKEMKRKGKEMLGNAKVYDDKEIKSAVEWLKEQFNPKGDKRILEKHKLYIDSLTIYNELVKSIDEAFEDVTKTGGQTKK